MSLLLLFRPRAAGGPTTHTGSATLNIDFGVSAAGNVQETSSCGRLPVYYRRRRKRRRKGL
jgi:hypothetical protein